MTAAEFLSQIRRLEAKRRVVIREIEAMRVEAQGTALKLDGVPHATGISDTTGNLAARLADKTAELEDLSRYYWLQRCKIVNMILQMNLPPEKSHYIEVLQLRYVEGLTQYETAERLGYAYRWTQTLQERALDAFAEQYKDILQGE